jgi:hypothetical protein
MSAIRENEQLLIFRSGARMRAPALADVRKPMRRLPKAPTPELVALSVLDEKLLLVLPPARLLPTKVSEYIDRSNPS